MNPSYFRIKLSKQQAIERLWKWNNTVIKERVETDYGDAVDNSLDDNGNWKGSCTYVYENEGWTIFEDLSGGYMAIPAESWLEFAGNDELVVAGYNDAILYGEMVVITQGSVQKEFFEDMDNPEENVNKGNAYSEINSWIDVATFVDDDELVYSESGELLIF